MLIIDVEIYRNYFLLSALNPESGKVHHFEKYEGQALNTKRLESMMRTQLTTSFNGLGFDLPLIKMAIDGAKVSDIKAVADAIITSGKPAWMIMRENNLSIPHEWDHIDLMDVALGQASLKIYGGRLNAPKLQDLPIEPDELISPEQRALLRDYCINDLETTQLLNTALKKEIALRVDMSKQYGIDLRSKGGAQVAKSVLGSLLESEGVPVGKAPTPETHIRYKDPGFFSFETDTFREAFERVKSSVFVVGANGQVKIPDTINKAIEFDGAKYKFGIGGLHSQEAKQAVTTDDDELLFELDVASMYPNIILGQNLYPKHLSAKFCKVYRGIVKRRLAAKHSGDKATADSLKLVINSSFGLFGSKYSFLYSPDLLIQVTITGQLALLMLIEKVTATGAKVVSANTDGVVIKCKKGEQYDAVLAEAFDWELSTMLELEETRYNAMYSQSVNNYLAVCDDGSVKRKGCFGSGSLSKNPDRTICYDAVVEYLSKGIPIAKTITECTNPAKFCTVRQVRGGAIWRGEYIGKAVRFYYTVDNLNDSAIHYKTNGNKVPKSDGSRPLMQLPESLPLDIDYSRYIHEAKLILKSVGVPI